MKRYKIYNSIALLYKMTLPGKKTQKKEKNHRIYFYNKIKIKKMSVKAKETILRVESIHNKWGKVEGSINFSQKDIYVWIYISHR